MPHRGVDPSKVAEARFPRPMIETRVQAFCHSQTGQLKRTDPMASPNRRSSSDEIDRLRRQHVIDAEYLLELVSGDPVRSLLRWLDDPQGFRARTDDASR